MSGRCSFFFHIRASPPAFGCRPASATGQWSRGYSYVLTKSWGLENTLSEPFAIVGLKKKEPVLSMRHQAGIAFLGLVTFCSCEDIVNIDLRSSAAATPADRMPIVRFFVTSLYGIELLERLSDARQPKRKKGVSQLITIRF